MAWIRNVSYSGTEFTDKNGDEIPVKLKGEDGYIDATAYQIYSTLTTKTDHSLAICGIVELDATGKPYLMLRDCVSMVPVPSITLKDGSSTTISMTENGEKTEGSATLPIRTSSKLTVKPAFATNAAIKAVFYSGNGYNGVECWGTITGTVAVSEQAFRNGIARLTLSGVSATYNNKTMLIPSDRSEYTLTLIDPLLSSPSYDTFAELNAAKPEEGTTVVTSTKHYQHYTLNTSGEWPLAHGMVSYIT